MDVANVVETKESSPSGSELHIERVQTLDSLQALLMECLPNNDVAQKYVMKHFNDPETLILKYGRSCMIASVLEHDFFGKICVLVWVQNPDHYSPRTAQRVVEQWAEARGCEAIVSFLDENGPWTKLKAYMRLTGLRPFRMVFHKKL